MISASDLALYEASGARPHRLQHLGRRVTGEMVSVEAIQGVPQTGRDIERSFAHARIHGCDRNRIDQWRSLAPALASIGF